MRRKGKEIVRRRRKWFGIAQSEGMIELLRLARVRAIKALPDRVEIHTSGPGTYVIHLGADRVGILSKQLGQRRGRRRPLATFLYFPDGEGATVLVEQNADRCTLVINEGSVAAGAPA